MNILGLSAFYHDSAAALVQEGKIVAAAQEERFTRRKHDASFPTNAVRYCLSESKLNLDEIDLIAFYDKPFLKFERLLETYLAVSPRGFRSFRMAVPLWLKEKLFQKSLLRDKLREIQKSEGIAEKLLFAEHHQSHAASAFYPSPFRDAAILTIDGVGEWSTTSAGIGEGERIEMMREIHFPHSLGMLYSAFTYYTGFKVNSGEYKLMGLAPYGTPRYVRLIRDNLLDVKPDGSFWLNQEYFNYCTGLTMTNGRFDRLFGGPPRKPEAPITQREMDLAASVQVVTEEILLRLARALAADTGRRNLCLAGGVALNCVANGKLLRDNAFERIWIQPAAGDAGGAIGAALVAYHGFADGRRTMNGGMDGMNGAYLGPAFEQDEIEAQLTASSAVYRTLSDDAMIAETVEGLAEGKAVGWMQGRMEFGPRALGNRSILGDPRSPEMQRTLNLKVKFRESFRPFAPSVLSEDLSDWFSLDRESPYMLLVADVAEHKRIAINEDERTLFGIDLLNALRSQIPAVTHVDYSARVQSVHAETNPRYHRLLSAFKEKTGCPILVNTSFNVRGEPIVCDASDAFRCFMGTNLDLLVCGNAILHKKSQDPSLARDYRDAFDPD